MLETSRYSRKPRLEEAWKAVTEGARLGAQQPSPQSPAPLGVAAAPAAAALRVGCARGGERRAGGGAGGALIAGFAQGAACWTGACQAAEAEAGGKRGGWGEGEREDCAASAGRRLRKPKQQPKPGSTPRLTNWWGKWCRWRWWLSWRRTGWTDRPGSRWGLCRRGRRSSH